MSYYRIYSKPSKKTLEEFKKLFGENYYSHIPNLLVSDDTGIAININPVSVSEKEGATDINKEFKYTKYLFSARVHTKRLNKYRYVKIEQKLYETYFFVKGLRLLRKHAKEKVDFWLISHKEDEYYLLGLGTAEGFIVIACLHEVLGNYIDLEKIVYDVERKGEQTKTKEKQKNTSIFKDLKIDLKTVEKWLKELKLDV